MSKWNCVYTKTVAGTVSQDKIDELRKSIKDSEDKGENMHVGIWNIELKGDSPDKEYAKYLMLEHETLEEEDLEMEFEDVDLIDKGEA